MTKSKKEWLKWWWNTDLDIDIGVTYKGSRGKKYIVLAKRDTGREIRFYEENPSDYFYRKVIEGTTSEEIKDLQEAIDILEDIEKQGFKLFI